MTLKGSLFIICKIRVSFGAHCEIVIKIALYLDPQSPTLAGYLFTYLFYFLMQSSVSILTPFWNRKCDIKVIYHVYLFVYRYQCIMACREGQKVSKQRTEWIFWWYTLLPETASCSLIRRILFLSVASTKSVNWDVLVWATLLLRPCILIKFLWCPVLFTGWHNLRCG